MSFNEFSQSVCVCIIQLKSEVKNWATTGRETKKIHPKFFIDFSSEPSLIKRREMKQKKSLKQKKKISISSIGPATASLQNRMDRLFNGTENCRQIGFR